MVVKGISVLIIFVLLSCSKDEGVETGTINEPDIDVILVGEDLERVYQYSYNSLNDSEIQSDLAQELGLGNSYITLRQEGNLLSFYIFASGNFSLIQKNVETGASSLETNFYVENNERNIIWSTNDQQNIYLGFFEPQGSSNFGVLVPNIFIDELGDVVILKSNQGENYSYAIYDADTFEPSVEIDFSLTRC